MVCSNLLQLHASRFCWVSVQTTEVILARLQGGDIKTPGTGSMFYLSQRPYLVAGSLRDQLTYPFPPCNVAGEMHQRDAGCFEHLPSCTVPPEELDARLEAALEAVELEYLLGRWVASWRGAMLGRHAPA